MRYPHLLLRPTACLNLPIMMKRYFKTLTVGVVFFFLFLSWRDAHAQGQRMEGVRIAFLTQDLQLTSTQAEKFWPVFNEYAAKRKTLHNGLRGLQEKAISETSSDKDIYASLDDIMALRKREVELTTEYIPKLKQVLTAHQLGRLVTIEKRMAKQLIRRQAQQNRLGRDAGTDME